MNSNDSEVGVQQLASGSDLKKTVQRSSEELPVPCFLLPRSIDKITRRYNTFVAIYFLFIVVKRNEIAQ